MPSTLRTVVDEGVEGFVDHGAPGEVRDGLELVVDVQLPKKERGESES